MSSVDVVVVGSYVQDHAWQVDRFPRPGETRRARGFSTGPGGKGFNQAIACLRQGVSTAFIGAIGADALGDVAQRYAALEGLNCRWLIRHDQPTAASTITVNASGENQIAVALGANEHLEPEFVKDASVLFQGARILLAQLENNLDAITGALVLARRLGLTRVLNPAPVHPELNLSLLTLVDVVTPNETEFALLLERIARQVVDPTALATLDANSLHALCRLLGVPTVVLTLGSAGCFVSHHPGMQRGDERVHYRLPAERVEPLDTTGAGDAFSGGLCAGLVMYPDAPFRAAVEYANRVAALSTEKLGTAPAMPTRGEVEARFGR